MDQIYSFTVTPGVKDNREETYTQDFILNFRDDLIPMFCPGTFLRLKTFAFFFGQLEPTQNLADFRWQLIWSSLYDCVFGLVSVWWDNTFRSLKVTAF